MVKRGSGRQPCGDCVDRRAPRNASKGFPRTRGRAGASALGFPPVSCSLQVRSALAIRTMAAVALHGAGRSHRLGRQEFWSRHDQG
jgi:hypothetical protein